MKAYLVQWHISQVLIEDVPDVINVKPTTALALLQGAQERRIRQQDILDVREYHLDRLGLQKPQHARIEYLCMVCISEYIKLAGKYTETRTHLDDELQIPHIRTLRRNELKDSLAHVRRN